MKCFNHQKESAIGICKSCGKGLCLKCAAELKNGLACKDSCERRVKILNKMVDMNEKVISTSNKNLKISGYFGLISGLLFIFLGYYFLQKIEGFIGIIFIVLGLAYMLSSIIRLSRKSQYPAIENED